MKSIPTLYDLAHSWRADAFLANQHDEIFDDFEKDHEMTVRGIPRGKKVSLAKDVKVPAVEILMQHEPAVNLPPLSEDEGFSVYHLGGNKGMKSTKTKKSCGEENKCVDQSDQRDWT